MYSVVRVVFFVCGFLEQTRSALTARKQKRSGGSECVWLGCGVVFFVVACM